MHLSEGAQELGVAGMILFLFCEAFLTQHVYSQSVRRKALASAQGST